MTRKRKLKQADEGMSLVLVLMVVTVIAVVAAAIVSQADTSVNATVGLRSQTGTDYAADGAGQVILNTLRQGTFNNEVGSTCFSGGSTMTVPYPKVTGLSGALAGSSYVQCTGEAGTGAQGSGVPITTLNQSGKIFAVGTGLSPDGSGISISSQGSGNLIFGSATSRTTISLSNATATAGVRAGNCTGVPGCTTLPSWPPSDVPIPVQPSGTPKVVARKGQTAGANQLTFPTCVSNAVSVFQPGVYQYAADLNSCAGSSKWMDFTPGNYYFDFQDTGTPVNTANNSKARVWTINGTVVGGTLNSALSTSSSANTVNGKIATDNACNNSFTSVNNHGVEFFFGGESQMDFVNGAEMQLCASYAGDSMVPTAIYGLDANQTAVDGTIVHQQSGCVLAAGAYNTFSTTGACQVLFEDDGNSANDPVYFIDGLINVPKASIYLHGKNSAVIEPQYGLVARWFSVSSLPQSAGLTTIPAISPGYGTASTIVDLVVYVCPTSSTCNASGKKQLTARVQIYDSGAAPVAGKRQIKILSWSQLR